MGDRDVGGREEPDLVLVDGDAVGAEKLRPEQLGERRDRPLAGRRDEHLGGGGERARAVQEPLVLAVALGEVGADRDPEREAEAVDLERAGVRRVG